MKNASFEGVNERSPARRIAIERRRPLIGGEFMKSKTVAILAMPGVQLLDVCGPLDVFAEANVQAGTNIYQLRVFGSVPGAIRSSSGISIGHCGSGRHLCPRWTPQNSGG